MLVPLLVFLLLSVPLTDCDEEDRSETISKLDEASSLPKDRRYLIYDVNMGEGFNLRRDVYMRVANLVRHLREAGHNFILVLPPFGGLYHWQNRKIDAQVRIPWRTFFDVDALNLFVPVIEFETFLDETKSNSIDHVYYLQHYAEGFESGKWEEKWDYKPCISEGYYQYNQDKKQWDSWFFGYESRVSATRFDCISVQGHSKTLMPIVLQQNETARSIMFDRAETVLHDWFGDVHYWESRRSMRYAPELIGIANEFRAKEFNSNDDDDQTLMHKDWREQHTPRDVALGGRYISAHLRRRDFVRSHAQSIPSIGGAATQLIAKAQEYEVKKVFLATDSSNKTELDELRSLLTDAGITMHRFEPSMKQLELIKEGGVSIVDQWVAAHAVYFIGTHVSTLSFRIQEDREILGFRAKTTFNRFCPDHEKECEQPSKWMIKYD